MRKTLLHIFDIYSNFKEKIYQNQNILSLSYEEHKNLILNENFSWSKNFIEYFNEFQNVQIISNDKMLQKKWCKENNLKFNIFQHEILLKQIELIKPDIIFFQNTFYLKKIFKFLNKYNFFFYDGVGENLLNIAKASNGVVTCLKHSYDYYQNYGAKCIYLPHSFNKKILNNVQLKKFEDRSFDIIFSGSIDNKGHFNRTLFLFDLSKNFNIKFFISYNNSIFKQIVLCFYFLLKKGILRTYKYILAINYLKKINLGSVYGNKMYEIISDSKITLNFHIENSKDEAANMRIFEVMGLGSCLVTENKKNIKNFFDKDDLVTYDDVNDAKNKIKSLLNNMSITKQIAKFGQKKVLNNHTTKNRLAELKDFFFNNLIN